MKHILWCVAGGLWAAAASGGELRIGIIGCDTSHVPAFTETLNNPAAKGHVPGGKVVAAFKGGSKDIPDSWNRVEGFSTTLREKYGVKFYDTIEELCLNVDAVLLESVDGRPHLEEFKAILKSQGPSASENGAAAPREQGKSARKPVYIDKPMGGSLRDVREIFRLAKIAGVPVFSSSSLRFGKDTQAVRHGSIGKVSYAETSSPYHLEPHHPDLFWYGVHGVESLLTVMGTGCESVQRGTTSNGKLEVIGTWSGERKGVFREDEKYHGLAKGDKGEAPVGSYDGYEPLIAQIMKFFQTGVAPVEPAETIEIFAFMEAADESKRNGGATVRISDVLNR
jgi:predicted dehydrogenase